MRRETHCQVFDIGVWNKYRDLLKCTYRASGGRIPKRWGHSILSDVGASHLVTFPYFITLTVFPSM